MRKLVFWITTLFVLFAVNFLVFQKERILKDGVPMRLRLAPVDPRSLLQGYYMRLDYELARGKAGEAAKQKKDDGCLVVRLDEDSVAHYLRIHEEEPLAAGESLLRYRWRGYLRIGAESFFFQEDHAKYYENAKYGELRVAESGDSVLVGLCDGRFGLMHPKDL